jgi:hypothetical protein
MDKRQCYRGDTDGGCKHWGADMDGCYCGHPLSLQETSFGRSTNDFTRPGRPCGPDLKLWEADTSCRRCRGSKLFMDGCEECGGTGLHQPEKSPCA